MLAKPQYVSSSKRLMPDYIVDSVNMIDFDILAARGIKAALIDLDGTVVSRGSFEVDSRITEYLKKQTITIYIATNRPKSRSLKNLKEALHASGVIHPTKTSMKPLPSYFVEAATKHQLNVSEMAMIGDRYLQDIYGANAAGLTTILVRKLGVSKGYIDTLISEAERKYTDKLAAQYI